MMVMHIIYSPCNLTCNMTHLDLRTINYDSSFIPRAKLSMGMWSLGSHTLFGNTLVSFGTWSDLILCVESSHVESK